MKDNQMQKLKNKFIQDNKENSESQEQIRNGPENEERILDGIGAGILVTFDEPIDKV